MNPLTTSYFTVMLYGICGVYIYIYIYIYILFGVEWVMPRRVLDLLSSWDNSLGRGQVKQVWKLVPLCVMWGLWRERNVRHFEEVDMPVLEVR
jgi:hypothetical protein